MVSADVLVEGRGREQCDTADASVQEELGGGLPKFIPLTSQ